MTLIYLCMLAALSVLLIALIFDSVLSVSRKPTWSNNAFLPRGEPIPSIAEAVQATTRTAEAIVRAKAPGVARVQRELQGATADA